MATLEQKYYETLARTDHPVFKRDLSETTTADSPFNSIMNRIMAKQFASLREDQDAVVRNAYPHTCDELGIDKYEETYFGFTKPHVDLDDRIAEVLIKRNNKLAMSYPDALATSESIVGETPSIIRNLYFGGWILDEGVLDVSAFLSSADQDEEAQIYIVAFNDSVDSSLLKKLDEELTKLEKGGSRHVIVAPPVFWVLDRNILDVDTITG